jgi:acylphosphatase
MQVCKHVTFSGQVQGVGFRATAGNLAQAYAVAGTVRNCADGTVELVVQGAADQVEGVLAAIRQRMRGYIAEERIQDCPVQPLQGFHIIR